MAKAAHGETTSEDLLLRVDPRIATGGHGHCFPVASMPFSKTFEYCYDDWSIAHVARKLGRPTTRRCSPSAPPTTATTSTPLSASCDLSSRTAAGPRPCRPRPALRQQGTVRGQARWPLKRAFNTSCRRTPRYRRPRRRYCSRAKAAVAPRLRQPLL